VGVWLFLNYWRKNEHPRTSYPMAFPRVGSGNDFLIPVEPNARKPKNQKGYERP